MALLQQFISNYKTKNLFSVKDRLVVAVSGGVDSVVLCKLCSLAGLEFAIAHCNFQLRSRDSHNDEAFVKKLALEFDVPFYSIKFETKNFAAENKLSTQEAARILRYDWFEKIRVEHNFKYILTAHHADDNVETVVMNFFRGTGIKGLAGISEKNGKIIRPLLFARRNELENFLKEYQLSYVQDVSNLSDDYTRNYFRNTILPMIAKVYPEVDNNILGNIERNKEVEIIYRQAIEQQKKKLLNTKDNDIYLPVLLLQQHPALQTIIYEITREYGFSAAQVPEVMALLESESGKYVASKSHRVLRNRKHLIISPIKDVTASIVIIEKEGNYNYEHGNITIRKSAAPVLIAHDANSACLDASKIVYPLILRLWKTGDYFYPLGMQKKKKLSRFFIDKKLSLIEKENIWVIEMNKKIIWVVGHRIDDRFKITPATKEIMLMKFQS
jgi:tRNA(Ile)-lysidine synthase